MIISLAFWIVMLFIINNIIIVSIIILFFKLPLLVGDVINIEFLDFL